MMDTLSIGNNTIKISSITSVSWKRGYENCRGSARGYSATVTVRTNGFKVVTKFYDDESAEESYDLIAGWI